MGSAAASTGTAATSTTSVAAATTAAGSPGTASTLPPAARGRADRAVAAAERAADCIPYTRTDNHRRSAGGASVAAQRRRRTGAGRCFLHRVAGHDHLGDRAFRSEHLRPGRRARRRDTTERRRSRFRRPRCRGRRCAATRRSGAASRPASPTTDRRASTALRRRITFCAKHFRATTRRSRALGAREDGIDHASHRQGRHPDRRAAQARIAGGGAADRPVADRLRGTDRRTRTGSGAKDHRDATSARRRRSRRSGGDDGTDRTRRLRPGGGAHPDRRPGVRRCALADRAAAGHHRLGRDRQAGPH